MKHLFLSAAILLSTSFFASAQIVNIPDAALKQWLVNYTFGPVIDTNGDGEIEVSEAQVPNNLVINIPVHDYTGLDAFTNLDTLSINNQNGLDVHPGHLSGVKMIQFSGPSYYGNIDLRACDSLVNLKFLFVSTDYSSKINSVNVSGLPYLKNILLDQTYTDTLIATNCSSLETLIGQPNGRIKNFLDLTGCTSLYWLELEGAENITTLDLSSCIHLDIFKIYASPPLGNLNLKNGRIMSYLDLGQGPNYPSTMNVCADEFEIDTVLHQLNRYQGVGLYTPTYNVTDYCSFFPAGNYNMIRGRSSVDMDNNGCSSADLGYSNLPIRITDGTGNQIIRYTSFGGEYAHYTYAGNFTLTPYFAFPYFIVNPPTAVVNFPVANNLVDTLDFCITPDGIHNDLDITALPLFPARLGHLLLYSLTYRNRGTTMLSGNVQINFDNSKMDVSNYTTGMSAQSPGQLTWNFNNLMPFESRTIPVYFDLFVAPNNVGDTLLFLATVNPVGNDETPANNSFILPQRITGAYDPNDKECLQGSKIGISDIGKPLDYIIRFQNIGNDTAFNVVVVDTLSNKLDLNSVEITATSHPCDIKQTNGKLEFFFKDINLPYASENEPASHGFIAFKIKPVSNLVIGDSLNNKAAIYFDFNAPVITNMATTIVSPTSSVPVKLEYFSLTSKNETNLLTWKAPSTTGTTKFGIERSNDGIHFNYLGNITASVDRCQLPFNLTDEKPFDGKTYYRLNIKDADGNSFFSKVLVAGRTKSGLSINAVVSDGNNTTIYLNASKAQTLQMKIIAADGRLMFNQSKTIEAGNSTLNLPLKNLATGIYTLIVYTGEGEVITKRFIK